MTTTDLQPAEKLPLPSRRRPQWTPAHTLAVVGAVFLVWEAWTVVAWLADGPTSVTQFRDTSAISWGAARVYEGFSIAMSVGITVYLIRQWRRERRLTFDAKLCLAGGAAYWLDPTINAFQPVFNYSSQWVNVQNWCGHMPLVINPDCGRMPEPWLHLFPIYAFGLLGLAMLMNAFMRAILKRWPTISRLRLLILVFLLGAALDIVWELPIIAMKLWAFPGFPDALTVFGHDAHRFPITEVVAASMIFTGVAALRFYKDDRGQTVVERGLDHIDPPRRNAIVLLALCGVTNGLFAIGILLDVGGGIYGHNGYPRLPAHLVNDMCNAPGVSGTRYGTCPGDPGYRAPIRRLPGTNP